jgi:anaerobic C4-dicarboxylate transporter
MDSREQLTAQVVAAQASHDSRITAMSQLFNVAAGVVAVGAYLALNGGQHGGRVALVLPAAILLVMTYALHVQGDAIALQEYMSWLEKRDGTDSNLRFARDVLKERTPEANHSLYWLVTAYTVALIASITWGGYEASDERTIVDAAYWLSVVLFVAIVVRAQIDVLRVGNRVETRLRQQTADDALDDSTHVS